MTLSNKLKYLMLQTGISANSLALITSIERSTLTKILNGTTVTPRVETIYTLAKYFKVDIAELIDNDHESSFNIRLGTSLTLKQILCNLMNINGITTISLLNKYTGVPTSILSQILNDKTSHPHTKTLHQLANFFNISIAQLSGIDKLPEYKTANVIPVKQMLPIILLEQVGDWISGNIQKITTYSQTSRRIIGGKAFALNIKNTQFNPDFTPNHTLIIDNEALPVKHDFLICKFRDNISIFECAEINDITITLREAGKHDYLNKNLYDVKILGVVVQQVINRRE